MPALLSVMPLSAALPLALTVPSLSTATADKARSVPAWICPPTWLSKLPDDRPIAWPLISTPLFCAAWPTCHCKDWAALSVPALANDDALMVMPDWSDCSVPLFANAPPTVMPAACRASMPPALVNDAALSVRPWPL